MFMPTDGWPYWSFLGAITVVGMVGLLLVFTVD
jgi:hypothetical protein